MSNALEIQHALGEIVVKPTGALNLKRLEKVLVEALDAFAEEGAIPASIVHRDARERNDDMYQTPGYYLRLYRHRADLTQNALAGRLGMRQHHLSEMENNKRPIGRASAKKLAGVLGCDYRRLL